MGAGTMRADNPKLHVRSPRMREHRRSLGRPDALIKVLVSASADLAPDSRFLDATDGGTRILATVDSAPQERIATLEASAEIWRVGSARVDLPELLQRLERRGVKRLLCEGGGELNWQLAQADLIDELNVTIAPRLLGGREAPTLLEGAGWSMASQRRLRLVDLRREQDEIYCCYAVER